MKTEVTPVVEAAIKAILSDMRRLGVTWTIAYGTTIDSSSSPSAWTIKMDGDDEGTIVDAVSLIGLAPDGARIAVMSLSIGLNYVIGLVGGNALANCQVLNTALGSGTTTSGSYADMAVAALTFTKQVNNSRLRIDISAAMFATVGSTKVRVGVAVNGSDFDIISFFISTANVVVPVVGSNIISVSGASILTIQPRWLRVSGTGTLTTSSSEDISMVVQEVD